MVLVRCLVLNYHFVRQVYLISHFVRVFRGILGASNVNVLLTQAKLFFVSSTLKHNIAVQNTCTKQLHCEVHHTWYILNSPPPHLLPLHNCNNMIITCFIMSGRPTGRGRGYSCASSKGWAGCASTCQSGGWAASLKSMAHLPFLSVSGCAIQSEHAEEVVEWITKP